MNYEFFSSIIQTLAIYFVTINLMYAVLAVFSWFRILQHSKKTSQPALNDQGVSFLIPAYNEEALIVETIQTYQSVDCFKKEMIIINDGSSDQTFKLLQVMFQMQRCKAEENCFVSITNPEIKMLNAQRMGKAQALNYGVMSAKYDLICTMDADSIPVARGIRQCLNSFSRDPKLIAAGGVIKVMNSNIIHGNAPTHSAPQSWLSSFQQIEYLRAFICERLGWSFVKSTLLISGAFCMVKKEALKQIGGFRKESITEDFDLIVRLRSSALGRKGHFTILPFTTCYTQVPQSLRHLRSQRKRWQYGLIETLSNHFSLFLNPKHGLLGMVTIPYFWLVEVLSPIIELIAFILLPVVIYIDWVPVDIALLWMGGTMLFNVILALFAADLDEAFVSGDEKFSMARLSWRSLVLHFGYRQLTSLWRLEACFGYFKKKHEWGVKIREEIIHS